MSDYKYRPLKECGLNPTSLNMSYKYDDPGNSDVVWLRVVKTLHWVQRPSQKRPCIPVGAITWVNRTNWVTCSTEDNRGCHPENNRHCCNFAASCFEVYSKDIEELPSNTEGLIVQSHNITEQVHPKKVYISSCNLKIVQH